MNERDPYSRVEYPKLIAWPERIRREWPLLEEVLSTGPSRRLLELGCGPGPTPDPQLRPHPRPQGPLPAGELPPGRGRGGRERDRLPPPHGSAPGRAGALLPDDAGAHPPATTRRCASSGAGRCSSAAGVAPRWRRCSGRPASFPSGLSAASTARPSTRPGPRTWSSSRGEIEEPGAPSTPGSGAPPGHERWTLIGVPSKRLVFVRTLAEGLNTRPGQPPAPARG